MARSKAQYENEIRTIVVGKVATSLRRARILSKIIESAENDDFFASGDFINPTKSGSLAPSKDDSWLVDPDSVVVSIDMKDGFPVNAIVRVAIKLGVNERYYYLSHKTPKKAWWPSGWETSRGPGLINWVRRKIQNGYEDFYYQHPTKGEIPVNDPRSKYVYSVAYLVGRKISERGHSKRTWASPFDDVDSVLAKALQQAGERIAELYQEATFEAIEDIYLDFI